MYCYERSILSHIISQRSVETASSWSLTVLSDTRGLPQAPIFSYPVIRVPGNLDACGCLVRSALWPFFHPSFPVFLSLSEHDSLGSYLILILPVCPVQVWGLSTQVGFSPLSAFEAQQSNCSYDSSCPVFLATDLTGQLSLAIVKSILALNGQLENRHSLSHVFPLGTLRVLHSRGEARFIFRGDHQKPQPQRHPDRTLYTVR